MVDSTSPHKTPKVDSTLSKGLIILEALAKSRAPKGVSELARELELTKSNAFRLLQTLTTLGYVVQTEDKLYRASLKTWQVGRSVVDNFNIREIAAPAMELLSQKTGETIYLAVPEGLSVVYVDKIESTQPIRSWNSIAGNAPIHAAATGKAILSANYGKYRGRLEGNLTKYTENTLVTIQALDADVLATRKRGFAIDDGEYRAQIHSYGAAILLPNGGGIAALGVSIPDVNLKTGDEERICNLVKLAAQSTSQRLARLS